MSPENGRRDGGVPSWEPLDGTVLVNAARLCSHLLSPLFTLHSLIIGKNSQLKKLKKSTSPEGGDRVSTSISHYVSHSHLGSLFDCSYDLSP